jgi:hypothetical protein
VETYEDVALAHDSNTLQKNLGFFITINGNINESQTGWAPQRIYQVQNIINKPAPNETAAHAIIAMMTVPKVDMTKT